MYDTFNKNYDTDSDPFNPMVLEPHDPFAALSANRNAQAIMSNFFTELQDDDRSGRDALYPSLQECPADCSGDGRVDVTEILTAVSIALEDRPVAPCARADGNHDGRVSIGEIIAGVAAALSDCRADAAVADPVPAPAHSTRRRVPASTGEVVVLD